ncbi:MAG TPA: hypothetical protein VFN49_09775 [Candidatus Aquilonibacter sp.]|nr:hypothetical protein [Candidatus Aquilonibacter sp.]
MLFGLLFAVATVAPATPPLVHDFYVAAIDAMSGLPQPDYVRYRIIGTSDGLPVGLTVDAHRNLWLNIGGGTSSSSWSVRHRTFDYRSIVTNDADGKSYLTARSFFDPTWYGTERALRKGMLNSQDPAPPRTIAHAYEPQPSAPLKTIAVTSVMSPSIYNIEDRGPATCADGNPGHALHLWSRQRDDMHQLSDVIVELKNMRFCMIRYSIRDGFGFAGIVEQHFSDVGGYWMQTDGFLDGTLRAFGIAVHHGIWRYRLADMTFPADADMNIDAAP